jgi:WD40 repeat protein
MGGYLWKCSSSTEIKIKIESIPSRRRKYTLPGNIVMTSDVKHIPLNQLKLLINDGNHMRVWQPATNSLSERLLYTNSHVRATAILPDNITGIVANPQGGIDIWNLSSSECKEHFPIPDLNSNRVMHVVTISENKVATVLEGDSGTHILDLTTKTSEIINRIHFNSINFISVTLDGNLIAASTDGVLIIFGLEIGMGKGSFFFDKAVIDCAIINKDEIVIVLENGEVWLVNMINSHRDKINLGIDASSITTLTSGLVATGSKNGIIVIWDPENGAIFNRFIAHRQKVSKLIAIAEGGFISGTGNKLSVWE